MDKALEHAIIYRDVKHPRLEYKTGTLQIILPKGYSNPEQILQKYQKWIQRKQKAINQALQEAETKTIIHDRTEEQLKTLVDTLVQACQKELNTTINKVFYRRMKTKWASHSSNSNLTINTLTKYLPNDLIEYILYHETAHNIERKHNENFWRLIAKKFPDYQNKEKSLLTYWFLTQRLQTR
ncbi:MAG: M48 family metallopeptidase [Candidatus Bathyarchaeia archaeon]